MSDIPSVIAGQFIVPEWGNAVADAINDGLPEIGSNANGNWAQFPSGLLVQWDARTVTDQAINSAYGTGVFIGARAATFPLPFAAAPVGVLGTARWGTGAGWGTVTQTSTTAITLRFHDTSSRASGTSFDFSWIAVGLAP